MEIQDPILGPIHILEEEIPILQHEFFQRLRNIKQLGFAEYVFPGATHSRFIHSIGVMEIGTRVFDKLFMPLLHRPEVKRLKETFKLACLLHDAGHAPLSHSTETVMPGLAQLNLPKKFLRDEDFRDDGKVVRQATHEDYTIKAIIDSPFSESFFEVQKNYGVEKDYIAGLIMGRTSDRSYFTIDGVDYFPLLSQLVSSEMDCDRMDYLLRDSYFCGVSYGNFDLGWLIDNLEVCIICGQAYLGITERAVVTFDDFLLSRFHMFLMVYFHYRSVCLEQLLYKFFETSPDEYMIPADINQYLEHDDHYLMKVLRNSKNRYAYDIIHNKIPQKIFESFNEDQYKILIRIQEYLRDQNIEYIKCSSSGRLSKYYTTDSLENQFPFKVSRTLFGTSEKNYFDIDQATDLFKKFSKSHAVNRLHCDYANLSANQQKNIIDIIHSEL